MQHPLVIGNWKLHGSTKMVKVLIKNLCYELNNITGCDVAIAPPALYLATAKQALSGSNIELGAQDVDVNISGAFTGDTSAVMLKDIGVKYIIIGHSERRAYHKESDEYIAHKFVVLKSQGLIPVLCIGESEEENSAGKTEQVCAHQIQAIFNHLGIRAFENSVIAYEPIWAIGTGKSATPAHAQSVHKFIRDYISKQDQVIAEKLIIQYGGSLNADNAAEIFSQPDINGALVGSASLKADVFSTIVKAAAAAKVH
ncbi:MAG: triose-phosphate isomerase [Candidatus Arsenophonus melophagi]|nr:triose-phosphate isomerase [Candidatus Arsenophonus melophagi]